MGTSPELFEQLSFSLPDTVNERPIVPQVDYSTVGGVSHRMINFLYSVAAPQLWQVSYFDSSAYAAPSASMQDKLLSRLGAYTEVLLCELRNGGSASTRSLVLQLDSLFTKLIGPHFTLLKKPLFQVHPSLLPHAYALWAGAYQHLVAEDELHSKLLFSELPLLFDTTTSFARLDGVEVTQIDGHSPTADECVALMEMTTLPIPSFGHLLRQLYERFGPDFFLTIHEFKTIHSYTLEHSVGRRRLVSGDQSTPRFTDFEQVAEYVSFCNALDVLQHTQNPLHEFCIAEKPRTASGIIHEWTVPIDPSQQLLHRHTVCLAPAAQDARIRALAQKYYAGSLSQSLLPFTHGEGMFAGEVFGLAPLTPQITPYTIRHLLNRLQE
jgi:hypothetical protein